MQRNSIVDSKKIKDNVYYCDFLLLELLDAVWISEIYKPHREAIIEIAKREIQNTHTLQTYTELEEKKETFRKILNLVN